MKTNITDTPKQIAKLVELLTHLGHRADVPRLYRCESCDPTYDAQRNLQGRTHYADPETLRFHKGRIKAAHADADGLLYLMLTSDAADPENRRRVSRVVCFDIFGTVLFRDSLDDAASTSEGARKHFEAFSINLTEHYRQVFAERVERTAKDLAELKKGLRAFGRAKKAPATPATV